MMNARNNFGDGFTIHYPMFHDCTLDAFIEILCSTQSAIPKCYNNITVMTNGEYI